MQRVKYMIVRLDNEAINKSNRRHTYYDYFVDESGTLMEGTIGYPDRPFIKHDSHQSIYLCYRDYRPSDITTSITVMNASYYINLQGNACGKCVLNIVAREQGNRHYRLTFNLTDDGELDGEVLME